MKQPKKRQRGRKPGRETSFAEGGRSIFDNLMRAELGRDHEGTLGGFVVHQLYLNRNPHPSRESVLDQARELGVPAEEVAAERREQARTEPSYFVAELLSAVDRRDWQFFEAAARTLRILTPRGDLVPKSPNEAAFLRYVGERLSRSPGYAFSLPEIRDAVRWPEGEPSEKTLRQLFAKFEVPRRLAKAGRPRGT